LQKPAAIVRSNAHLGNVVFDWMVRQRAAEDDCGRTQVEHIESASRTKADI
jgi:hypothetical protein